MREIDDGPSYAGWDAKDREHSHPREEKNEYVDGPDPRVGEPLSVPIQIRRRSSPHIIIRHPKWIEKYFLSTPSVAKR